MISKKIKKSIILTACLFVFPLSACNTRGRTLGPRNTPTPQQQSYQMPNTQNGTLGNNYTGIVPDGNNVGNLNNNYTGGGATPRAQAYGMLGTTPENNPNNALFSTQQLADNRQKADNIRAQLQNLPDVQNAKVIVMGNTALVNYTPSSTAVDPYSINNSISSRIKATDASITDVRVTSSPEIGTRMNRLSTDIANNGPMDGIATEFNRIIQNINPPLK